MRLNHEIEYFDAAPGAADESEGGAGWYWWCEDEWIGPFESADAAETNSEDYFG